ncbi:DinB family protein [Rhizobium esperanzae]|uniref:Putative damage-inducible protein DinB n=1 Tax=Rhizobium esperanzae TaxID=1967781 RepID=A0A7W6W365_9HYPH|nr:DinB family protein [Rhizobium esperanzae]MBB4234088.1 putative damage-inducible protein DinB [Rhizobium esperanzae]
MSAQTLLNQLFRYKASIDDELLDALNGPGEGAPTEAFSSALRVLNHAHLVDRIFAANLQRQGHSYAASWSSEAPSLAQLASDIRETDRWYMDYTARLTPEELEEVVDFTFTDGGRGRMSREEMLAHVATHAGYHRGEVARLLPDIESTAMRDVFAGYLHRTDPARRQ